MEEFLNFLRRRGLAEDEIQRMKDEKIDTEALLHMSDLDMKNYIPLYGDRIAAVAYARSKHPPQDSVSDSAISGTKGSCLYRLQNKLSLRKRMRSQNYHNDGPSTSTSIVERPANKHKITRRVEVGWMDYETRTGIYRQVRSQKGGGTRHLEVQKDMGVGDLLPLGIALFFPDGVSPKGKTDDFVFTLKDFRMSDFGTRTVSEIYEESKIKLLRIYVCSKLKNLEDSPQESLDMQVTGAAAGDCLSENKNTPVEMTENKSSNGSSVSLEVSTNTAGGLSCLEGSPEMAGNSTRPTASTETVGSPCTTGLEFITETADNSSCSDASAEMTESNEDTLPDITIRRPHMADALGESMTSGARAYDSDTGTPTVRFNHRPRLVLKKSTNLTKQETLMEILHRLDQKVDTSAKNIVNVDRSNVLDGGFRGFSRATFNPWRKLSVRFVEEDAIDDGGPMREFLRLAVAAAKNLPIFSGGECERSITLDYNALNKNVYFDTGRLLAYSIVHRGPTPRFFSKLLFNLLADDADRVNPKLEDIEDYELRDQVSQIRDSTTANSYRDAVNKSADTIAMAGCISFGVSQKHRDELVGALVKFLTVDRLRPALDQFKKGLQSMGLIDEMKTNRELWKEVFLSPTKKTLDPAQLDALFAIKWSEEAESNRRAHERRVVSYWRDLLEDLADGIAGPITGRVVTLGDVLVFATGAASIPHLGFNPDPSISFLHPEHVEYEFLRGMPKSNTCAMELKLPISNDFDEFKANVLASLEMVTTFTTH